MVACGTANRLGSQDEHLKDGRLDSPPFHVLFYTTPRRPYVRDASLVLVALWLVRLRHPRNHWKKESSELTRSLAYERL